MRNSDSSHWYYDDGKPCYEITGKNGNLRSPTVRDAKTMGNIVPSVTTKLSIIAKPAITNWLRDVTAKAAFKNVPFEKEPEQEYVNRLYEITEAESQARMQVGTDIHDLIEKGFKESADNIYFHAVKKWVDENYPGRKWVAEASFATRKGFGFGGKIDLCTCDDGRPIVIDYKSKEFADGDKAKKFIYDEHGLQLAGYLSGKFCTREGDRVNLFIRPTDAAILSHVHDSEDDFETFLAVSYLWNCLKGIQNKEVV